MKTESNINLLFEPRGIAVVGASHSPGKIGNKIVENIITCGYRGNVYPVNPKGGKVLDLPAFTSVSRIEGDVDVAVIVIPEKYVLDSVKDCAKKGVKHLVIITSGFSEVGKIEEEKRIVSCAKENGMRVLGPNIFGIYSSSASLNATFGPRDIKPGNVAIITQSGAIGIAMIGKTKTENIGLSSIVSVGNKADINEADLLEYLAGHKETKIILMYIEGVQDGEHLVSRLKEVARIKPVVAIKSGRSKRGAIAAASHTGSLAGADEVFDDIARQCGVIRAESIQEAMDWCRFFEDAPVPKGERAVIVTNGGGIGVLATDACEKYKVNLYDNLANLKKIFSDVMPDFGSAKNPIDITGEASADDYNMALTRALESSDVDSVICLGCETAMFNAETFGNTMKRQTADYSGKKPIVFSVFGGEEIERTVSNLKREGVPVFPDVYEAVSCLGALYEQYRTMKKPAQKVLPVDVDMGRIGRVVQGVRDAKRNFLLSDEAHEVMSAAGIRMPESRVARNVDEAVKFAEEMGYPVVMKIVSKDIIHKSDAGGVALDIENKQEVIDAYESILHSCRQYKRNAVIKGIEIVQMVPKGVETIIGARRDASFGPVVMFGLGGIYVEVMKDVSFRAFPVSILEVHEMISGIRSYPLLLGVRGEKRKDIDGIADVIMKTGRILKDCPDITDIEINPLLAYDHGEGVVAVDARILLRT